MMKKRGREKKRVREQTPAAAAVQEMSGGLPEGFLKRLRADESVDGEALAAALREAPATGVRLNPRKPGGKPDWLAGGERVPWCDDAFYLAERPDFTLTPSLHAGAFYVQDPSSTVHELIVSRLVGTSPLRVLDLCAAPGGKSTAAAASLPEGSLLVSNEVMPDRARILAENMLKWGFPGQFVTQASAEAIGGSGALFDIIILDAPCSGEGMMRKEPRAVTQWTPSLVTSCARLQRQIAADIMPALRPGGYLIYSTCTFSREENEENVRWLTETYGFESVDMWLDALGVAKGFNPELHTYRFMPHLTRGEGLFVAVLRLPEDGATPRRVREKPRRREKQKLPALPQWLERQEEYTPVAVGDKVMMLPSAHFDVYERLTEAGVRFLHAGVGLCTLKGREAVPQHSLALSTALRGDAFPDIPLGDADALSYLRRDLPSLSEGSPTGYVTVSWRGHRLGFLKNLGTRANSLYPPAWRVRKT